MPANRNWLGVRANVIPEFNDNGYLPSGIHPATLEQVETRFGGESELRRVEMQSLAWLVDLARRASIQRIIVNGSFVTDAFEPNDVDCVLLVDVDFPHNAAEAAAEEELLAGLPFLQIDIVTLEEFARMVERVFGTDRQGVPKGVVELIAWN